MSSRLSLEAILSLTDNMTAPYRRTTNKVNALSNSMRGGFKSVAMAAGRAAKVLAISVVGAVSSLAGGITLLVREASKIEDATARFTPLMGSVERANDLVAALNETAATTPFQFENIADVANSLLPAMNGDIEKTVETFRMLGDSAGGSAERLNTISAVFTRSILKNKVEVGDLNMLVSAGIPIYGELAKTMGVTVEEMAGMVSQGKVTGDIMEKTFQNMTSEGGIFYNGMQIASETLTGKISTMMDNFKLLGATLGQAFLPIIKDTIDVIIGLTGNFKDLVVANREVISTKIKEVFEAVKKVVESLREPMMGLLKLATGLGKYAMPLLLGIIKAFGDTLLFILPLVNSVVDFFKGLFNTLKESGQLDRIRDTFTTMAQRLIPLRDTLIDIIATVRQWLEESGALDVIVALFRILGAVVGTLAVAFQILWRIVKPILNGIMVLLTPIFKLISAIIDGMTFVTEGIGGILNTANERGPKPETNIFGMPTRSAIEQQQAVVAEQRAQEDSQQRSSYDVYLHSAIPGTALSQMGQAPSTAVNLGGNQ